MKKIGILGGLGPESTIAYYKFIVDKYYGIYKNYAYPEIIIYSLSFQEFIGSGYESPSKVKAAIEKLHKAGADFVVAACNSVHIIFDEVSRDIPIPWISIIDVTAEQILKAKMKKVGLLGTIFTMGKGFYQKGLAKYNIETVTPNSEDQRKINTIIYKELVRGIVKKESLQFALKCMNKLKKQGAEGIILGCTELPFLINQKDTDIPVFDTVAIHAGKALDLALEDDNSSIK